MYFIVGTAMVYPEEAEPKQGRIIVFHYTDGPWPPRTTSLSLLGTKYTFPVSFFTLILIRLASHFFAASIFLPGFISPPCPFCHFVPSCSRFPLSSCYFIITFHRTLCSRHFSHNHSHFNSCSPSLFFPLPLHHLSSVSRCIAGFLSNPPILRFSSCLPYVHPRIPPDHRFPPRCDPAGACVC